MKTFYKKLKLLFQNGSPPPLSSNIEYLIYIIQIFILLDETMLII